MTFDSVKNMIGVARAFHGLTIAAAVALMAVGLWLFAHRHEGVLKHQMRELIEKRDSFARVNYRQLNAFYQARSFKPVWISGHGLRGDARILRETLEQADRDALLPSDYHVELLETYWDRNRPEDLARLEFLLTDAFMRYGVEVKVGYQFPRSVDPDWMINPERVDAVELLNKTLDASNFSKALAALPPQQAAYQNLRASLRQYRDMLKDGAWPQVQVEKDVKPGSAYAGAQKLYERLTRESYLKKVAKAPAKTTYDAELVEAVKTFQIRHGLAGTGVLDRTTARAMNKPIAERIAEIEKNMERWRWLPREFPQRYVEVNIADYKLTMYENNAPALDMKVIIGKKYRATPVIASTIEYVDLNPTWNVPMRIAREDMLPKQRDDDEFFDRKGIRVLSKRGKKFVEVDPAKVNWDQVDDKRFPYYLQQAAGDQNSLGRIKFGLPNRYDIYLHDTPQRELFRNNVRAFSSGCIRVEHPERLAAKVLEGTRWTSERIENVLETENTIRIGVAKPLPVYILYLTAWSDGQGQVNFRDDVYIRDRALPDHLTVSAAGKPGKLATAGI